MTVHSALVKELARRGHQVTVFSPFPEKYPIRNFNDVEFKLSYHELRQNFGEHKTRLLRVLCLECSQIVKQSLMLEIVKDLLKRNVWWFLFLSMCGAPVLFVEKEMLV
jgi:hypothetical protein